MLDLEFALADGQAGSNSPTRNFANIYSHIEGVSQDRGGTPVFELDL